MWTAVWVYIGLASTWFPADAHSSGELWRIERERFRVICWPSCLHDGGVKSALGRNGNSCLRCLVTHFSGKPFQRRDSHNKNTRKGSQRKFLSCATLALSTISTRATDTFATRKVDFEKCAPCARVKSNQVERALLFHYTNFSADIHNTFRGRHIKTCHSHFAIWERCFNKNQSQRKREHIYISTQRVEQ